MEHASERREEAGAHVALGQFGVPVWMLAARLAVGSLAGVYPPTPQRFADCVHAVAGTRAKVATLSGGGVFLCAGIAFKAHGGDAAVSAADSGLLAIRTIAGALLGERRTSSF